MNIFLQIIFWAFILLFIHSYIFYPVILFFLSKNKEENKIKYTFDQNLPRISILMAVHNEEAVIAKKIQSVFKTNYPVEKIEFLIGSDNSSDNTNELIIKLKKNNKNIKFFNFKKRYGKIKIINLLSQKAENEILISTDAKAFFEEDTIFRLIEDLKNTEITMVGACLINPNKKNHGISAQENMFMNREMKMKYREGLIWQSSIGVYGALYAIRKNDFLQVPENLLVDDFYLTMKILEKQGKVIFNLKAKAQENLPVFIDEEFRRKVRISTGNFQNLKIFAKIILKPFSSLSFAFISHKVIRWISPILFIFSFISALLMSNIWIYKLFLYAIFVIFSIPVIDYILQKFKININIFRLISHFLAMNLAILVGFMKSIVGVKKNYWKPSNRTH